MLTDTEVRLNGSLKKNPAACVKFERLDQRENKNMLLSSYQIFLEILDLVHDLPHIADTHKVEGFGFRVREFGQHQVQEEKQDVCRRRHDNGYN